MAISTFLGNALLNEVFNNTNYTPPATVYVSLHDGDPGLTGANEITAGANTYARQAGSFGTVASKAVSNDAELEWTDLPSVTLSNFVGIWDAATAGNFLWAGTATWSPNGTIAAGGTLTIAIGDIDVSI